MKSSWHISPPAGGEYEELLAYDRSEIDNPDPRDPVRLHYVDRLQKIISLVRKYFPHPEGVSIADLGCNQGNAALLLAEAGYQVYAVDCRPASLEYSRLKYEQGCIQWIASRIDELPWPEGFVDAAVIAETLTLSASPAALLAQAARFVRPGGMLLVTTPNGSRWRSRLPSWEQFQAGSRAQRRQGAGATPEENGRELFRLSREALLRMIPPGMEMRKWGFCGGTVLSNRHTRFAAKWLSPGVLQTLAQTPLVNRKIFRTLFLVLQKVTN